MSALRRSVQHVVSLATLCACLLPLCAAFAQPGPGLEQQRAAMAKLGFLVGRWSGPVTITRGPGEPMHLAQTEDVQLKLDGLVLLIQGTSRDAAGKVVFQALATVAFDASTGTYRFRAYNDGRYLDTELTVPADGFSWHFAAGPAHVTNTMHLTPAGEWAENTGVAMNGAPPRQTMEMVLKKQP